MKYHRLGVCATCYGGLAYWRGRSIAHKRYRMEQIKRLKSRMDFMIDNPRVHPKKKPIKRRKR